MGVQSCELYCNIGLCCLYGGQLDLVLPCFQRAMRVTGTPEQRADLWYNLSFVAMVRNLNDYCVYLYIAIKVILFIDKWRPEFGSTMPSAVRRH